MAAAFHDIFETFVPFGIGIDDEDTGKSFAKEEDDDFLDKIETAGVGFDEENIANNRNKHIKESAKYGADADFATVFAGGKYDKKRRAENDGEGD